MPVDPLRIHAIRTTLAGLVANFHPETPEEWDAFEKLVAAHKDLRAASRIPLGTRPLPGLEVEKK